MRISDWSSDVCSSDLVYSIWLSMHEWNRFTRAFSFVGGEQWMKALSDPRMWHSLGVTSAYTVICLVAQLALGLGIALLLDRDRRGYEIGRASGRERVCQYV